MSALILSIFQTISQLSHSGRSPLSPLSYTLLRIVRILDLFHMMQSSLQNKKSLQTSVPQLQKNWTALWD